MELLFSEFHSWLILAMRSRAERLTCERQDIFVILFSSCARFLPRRRGYSRLSLNGNGNARGRDSEDQNRLIDELDESWDD